jgi:hypothetical protein
MNADIETTLDVLIGHAAWSVRHTHGSCFFMEFGNPHMQVREPLALREGMSKERALMRKRRRISLRGDWSLLVYASNWSLRAWEFSVDHEATPSEMEQPFLALDGQRLKSVCYVSLDKTTTLTFDLGAELRLWPNANVDEEADQWSLASIDGVYRSFIHSGKVIVKSGDKA